MSVLKIDMTYQCTAECEHCRFWCTREPQPVIDVDMAVDCIEKLKKLNDLQLVVVMGGEPGLYPNEMHALLAASHALGLMTRLETNAFWAVDDDAARKFLEPLYKMNTQVAISLDAFHAPYVPPERVTTALKISEELGGECWTAISLIDSQNKSTAEDKLTLQLIKDVEEHLGHKLERSYQGRILYAGRPVERLANIVKQGRGVPTETCNRVPWWMDGYQESLYLLSLDPDGYLSKGCGIAIGNIKNQSIESFLESYDAHKHPILRTLLEKGPLGLAEEAAELGFELQDDYADRCHLCQEAREVLREKYPEYLVPRQHYRQP